MTQTVDPFIPVHRPKPHVPQGQYGQQYLRKPHAEALPLRAIRKRVGGQETLSKPTMPQKPTIPQNRRPAGVMDGFLRPSHPAMPPQKRSPSTKLHSAAPGLGLARHKLTARPARPLPQPKPTRPTAQTLQHSANHKVSHEVRHGTSWVRRLFERSELAALLLGSIAVGLFIQSLVFGELVIIAYAVFALVRHIASRTTFLLAVLSLVCVVVLLIIRPVGTMTTNFAVYSFLLLVVGTITLGREIHTAR